MNCVWQAVSAGIATVLNGRSKGVHWKACKSRGVHGVCVCTYVCVCVCVCACVRVCRDIAIQTNIGSHLQLCNGIQKHWITSITRDGSYGVGILYAVSYLSCI
jgi:hypothetical protein